MDCVQSFVTLQSLSSNGSLALEKRDFRIFGIASAEWVL
jgi:hypothetical protein